MSAEPVFSYQVTMNYEDTDAAGVVYHANYLAYMERTRSAYLRSRGLPLTVARDRYNVVFVVAEVCLNFWKPAVLDDVIEITLQLEEFRGVSVRLRQNVHRGDELLVEGQIRLAILRGDTLKPCRLPETVRQALVGERIK